ncbi:MAG: OmpA family protein [Nitrospirae bacterium]|nr:OmpA family protein [Nitrospirota bacterium]
MNIPDKKTDSTSVIFRNDPIRALREKSRSTLDLDSNWLITLSDVLSLLLVFFVMFMVTAKTAAKSQTPPLDTGKDAISSEKKSASLSENETILTDVNAEIKNLNLENEVSVHRTSKAIVITLKEKVTFKPGEAEVLSASEPILDHIAQLIQRYPSFLVEIEGHTDNMPIKTAVYPSNWELSVARSTGVLKYFIGRHGISPSRLSIKGSADQKPVASNDTPEDRAQNRRVEIKLKENDS